jgi:hypothetical protein
VTPAKCKEYVAVLSGEKKDDAMLADPELKEVAARSFDLIACRAVATGSDASCALVPENKDECRLLWSILHELRTNPQGRSFMFPDIKYQMCRADPDVAPICDRLRDALRSGDPKKCAGIGSEEATCRAMVSLDKSLCGKGDDRFGCTKAIEAGVVFSKGLKSLAESGPPRERALAKAALGEADACESFARAALEDCPAPTTTSTTNAAVPTTTVPTPSRDVPAPGKSPS